MTSITVSSSFFGKQRSYDTNSFTPNLRGKENMSYLSQRPEFLSRELDKIYEECSSPNWSGDGAEAISITAVQEAKALLYALPSWLPLPEASPEPDGDIALEWNFGKDRLMSLSFSGDNTIVYVAILGKMGLTTRKRHGTEIFNNRIPKEIIQWIRQIED